MDILNANDIIPWRAAERLLIVAVGALCIYLGYRLFWSIQEFKNNSEGKVELPGGISIHLSRVGPGVFFALFGALIVGTSTVTQLNFTAPKPAIVSESLSGAPASISYATDNADVPVLDQQRAAVLRDMDALTSVTPALTAAVGGNNFRMNAADATRLLISLPHIRRSMLLSVWDSEHWGTKDAFVQWIDHGQKMPPPEQIRIAAELLIGNTAEMQ